MQCVWLYVYACVLHERWVYVLCCVACMSLSFYIQWILVNSTLKPLLPQNETFIILRGKRNAENTKYALFHEYVNLEL